MSMNKLAGLVLFYIIGQLTGLTLDGLFWGNATSPFITMLNNLMGFTVVTTGSFSMVTTGISWLTDGISKLLFWNYSFLQGGAFIVRIILFAIFSIPSVYGLWQGLRGNSA
jgi:hypothetical protein